LISLEISRWGYQAGRDVLKGINWELDPGKVYILSGENGCGKSTLLKLMAGVLPAGTAKIETGGIAMHYLAQDPAQSLLGIVPAEDLEIWKLVLPELDIDKVKRELRYPELLDTPYTRLSSGMLRTAAQLCLPYLMDKFWLLDEPFAGLDDQDRERLLRLVIKKQDAGSGALIVSHEAFLKEQLGAECLHLEKL
jgi:ABC-type transport system involved in cytochrome c biogenesis ATPase subunit